MEETTATEYPLPDHNQIVNEPAPEPMGPDNPPWGSAAGFGLWLASVALIVVLPSVFLLPYLATQSLDFSNEPAVREFADTDRTAILIRIAAIIPAHLLTLLLGWIIVTRFGKISFRKALGWENGGFFWWHHLIVLGVFYILAVITTLVFPNADNEMLRILQSSKMAVYFIAVMATFTAPLVEELVYRGVMFSSFQRTFGAYAAIAIVTVLFAGVHFLQYWGSPGTLIMITLLSLGLTVLRYKTRNLKPSIVLHTLINGIQSLMLVLATFAPEAVPQGFFHVIK